MNSKLLGAFGEQQAAKLLRADGYEIYAANYSTFVGELDIVALKDNVMCFVEVKTRQVDGMTNPADAVDARKEENIKGSAAAFMNRYSLKHKVRFDIIEVYVEGNRVVKMNHIKNAF